jgi:nucleoside phosphorylase
MQKLAIETLREASLMQRDNDIAVAVACGRHDNVCRAFAAFWRGQIDIAFADRSAAFLRLNDQLEDRTSKRDQFVQPLTREKPGADREKLLCSRIDRENPQILANQQDRHRQNGEDLSQTRPIDFGDFA